MGGGGGLVAHQWGNKSPCRPSTAGGGGALATTDGKIIISGIKNSDLATVDGQKNYKTAHLKRKKERLPRIGVYRILGGGAKSIGWLGPPLIDDF